MFSSKSLLATLVIALSGFTAHAGKPAGKYAKKAPEPPRHTLISSIAADSISVKGSQDAKTYKISKDTVIEFKGQRVKVEDLKAGMRVTVTAGSDPTVAGRIAASEAPDDAPPAGAAAKGKGKK